MARYDRYLSDEFLQLLQGPLEFLIKNASGPDPGDPYAVDVQFREGDVVQCYHGTTSLLRIERPRSDQPELIVSAADAHCRAEDSRDAYHQLVRRWNIDTEAADLQGAIVDYLPAAIRAADARYYRNEREGFWQNRVCIDMGIKWRLPRPWIAIDREAVIGFDCDADKGAFYTSIKEKYVRALNQLAGEHQWARHAGGFGDELDVLAINSDDDLLCIELKHGSNTAGIYYGTLQAAVYRDAFSRVLPEITAGIKALIEQKIQLGLLPSAALDLIPKNEFRQVRGMLLVAEPNPASECWNRLATVMEACEDARMPVLAMSKGQDGLPRALHEVIDGVPNIIRESTLTVV